MEKPSLKITKTEKISEFCGIIKYLLRGNGVYIYNKNLTQRNLY